MASPPIVDNFSMPPPPPPTGRQRGPYDKQETARERLRRVQAQRKLERRNEQEFRLVAKPSYLGRGGAWHYHGATRMSSAAPPTQPAPNPRDAANPSPARQQNDPGLQVAGQHFDTHVDWMLNGVHHAAAPSSAPVTHGGNSSTPPSWPSRQYVSPPTGMGSALSVSEDRAAVPSDHMVTSSGQQGQDNRGHVAPNTPGSMPGNPVGNMPVETAGPEPNSTSGYAPDNTQGNQLEDVPWICRTCLNGEDHDHQFCQENLFAA